MSWRCAQPDGSRRPKKCVALRESIRVAELGLAAAVAELRPGVSEKALVGVLLEAMAAGGVSTPSTQDAAWVTARDHPWRRANPDGLINEGDLVAFSSGVLDGGYTGEVGRTWPVGEVDGSSDLYRRWDALWDRLYEACHPGAPAIDLVSAYQAAGEELPPMPIARGLGLGFDPPVVSRHLPATAAEEQLEPGMVLAVTGYVWESGVGAVFGREAVLITPDGPEVLTSSPSARYRGRRLIMAEGERPSAEEIILYAAIESGLADSVRDNDARFPPDFRLSKSGRSKKE